jgi:ribose transport system permease protein
LGLLLVIALFSFLLWRQDRLENFHNWENIRIILVHASIVATVAFGMTLIMISGGIDLSVGYVVSLVTVVTVLVYRWASSIPELSETASLWAILAGSGTGALAGLGNGVLITLFRVAPFVVTLGMMCAARGLARSLSGGQPVYFPDTLNPPAWVRWLGALQPRPRWMGLPPGPWMVFFLALAAALLLRFTVLGRYIYALGSSEPTARLCGIKVARTRILIYFLAGLLTGWAGILQTARSESGNFADQAGMELDVIAAVVIGGGSLTGGEGTIIGTLVGALLLQVLENGCTKLQLPREIRFMLIGAIIVGVGALNSWRQRRLR